MPRHSNEESLNPSYSYLNIIIEYFAEAERVLFENKCLTCSLYPKRRKENSPETGHLGEFCFIFCLCLFFVFLPLEVRLHESEQSKDGLSE